MMYSAAGSIIDTPLLRPDESANRNSPSFWPWQGSGSGKFSASPIQKRLRRTIRPIGKLRVWKSVSGRIWILRPTISEASNYILLNLDRDAEMNVFSNLYARLVRSIRYALILSEIEDLTSQESYEEALTKLHIAEKIHSDLEVRIRKAFLQFVTGDFRGSIALSLSLHSDIEEDDRLSKGNKAYMNEYVLGLWEAASEFDDFFLPPWRDLDSVDLKLVSARIKRKFPLREHPDWGDHGTDR